MTRWLAILLGVAFCQNGQDLESKLCEAIRSGNVDRVKDAFTAGSPADVQCSTDDYGRTPALSVAAKMGNPEIIRVLHGLGADLEARTERFRLTPLIIAVENGSKEAVAELIELGADPDARDGGNATAIMYAVEGEDEAIATLLINAGANVVDKQGGANRTPLLAAIAHGNAKMVPVLIRAGADINKQGGELAVMSPLMLAASQGNADIVRELLEAGADIDATSVADGKTALDYAKLRGHDEVVRLLTAAKN
jgi:ankyrin repeat protein